MLKDLLNFSSEQIEKVKVKFNQHNGDTNPMEEYIKKLMMMYENVDYKRQNGELMKERLNIFSYSNFILSFS